MPHSEEFVSGSRRDMEDNTQLLKIQSDNQSKRTQIIHWGVFFFITLLTFGLIAARSHEKM